MKCSRLFLDSCIILKPIIMHVRKLPVIVALLLILGAGCAKQPDTSTPTPSKPAGDTSTDTGTNTGNPNGPAVNTNIDLTGEATGTNSVRLEWTPSDDVAATAESWIIVQHREENPEYPDKKSFWFERGASFREKDWNNLPAGVSHFRVCAVVNGECTEYSNDITFDLPGRTSVK